MQNSRLTSLLRKAIKDLRDKKEAYQDTIEAQPRLKYVYWGPSFPGRSFRSVVRARMLGEKIFESSQLTNIFIKIKLEVLNTGTMTVSTEEALADLKKRICFDAFKPIACSRTMILFAS